MKNKRNNQRKNLLNKIRTNLVNKLSELSQGLNVVEIVKVHTDFYFTCNPVEQEMLMEIFKATADTEIHSIFEFYIPS